MSTAVAKTIKSLNQAQIQRFYTAHQTEIDKAIATEQGIEAASV